MNKIIPADLINHEKDTCKILQKLISNTSLSHLSEERYEGSFQHWLKAMVCSDFVTRQLERHFDVIAEQWLLGDYCRNWQKNDFSGKLSEQLRQVSSEAQLMQVLRNFRNQQMVRISFRDINGLVDLQQVLLEQTELANCTIRQALYWLEKQQQKEFGTPLDAEGNIISLVVMGMGKLGAYELNFSSDVDLVFAFSEHGETVGGPRSLSHNEYFIKLGQRLIKVLDQKTVDGFVFRVDMRLRPFGQSGPLVVTYGALEDYYSAHGREWERYALIKARVVTGSLADKKTLYSLLRPFVYRRYIDFGVFESLREMKSMISREVQQKKKEHNIKLGAGGIREIEFMVQAFQLLRGGRDVHLQQRQVLKILSYLDGQKIVPQAVVTELLHCYDFLRRTEHRLQQIDDQQTHNLPANDFTRARISYGMGYEDWTSFSHDLQQIRDTVQTYFEQMFMLQQENNDEHTADLQGIWQARLSADDASHVLSELGYTKSMMVIEQLQHFRESHHYRKISKEGSQRLDKLMPLVLKAVSQVDDSETTLRRIIEVLESVCRRSVYLALLIENPQALLQLVKLCAASSWITRLLSRYPALFDELLNARELYAPLQRDALFSELEEKMSLLPINDLEQRMETLRHFKQSQTLRVAAADVTGVLPLMKVSDYLTWIAEVILHFVLQTAWHDMVLCYGQPCPSNKNSDAYNDLPEGAGFAMLGFGKMGGLELGYSSDLDLVFLFANDFNGGMTNASQIKKQKSVDNLQFYSRLSQRIMHILQTRMPSGILYEADMRLRPNGHSGLIINSIKAFSDYELHKAWVWEHQALVRARFIGGDEQLKEDFKKVRREVLVQSRETQALKEEVREMRIKMRQTLAKKKKGFFDIKQGFGGIADIEFIVQFMVLNHAAEYPGLLTWTDNIRILEKLEETALLSSSMVTELSDFYRCFRARLHQLSLQEVPGIVAEKEFKEERQKIQQIWQEIMS